VIVWLERRADIRCEPPCFEFCGDVSLDQAARFIITRDFSNP
jgi:hypothetical protein